jgi:hypothetical protein
MVTPQRVLRLVVEQRQRALKLAPQRLGDDRKPEFDAT